jgi:hypothetical protein
MPSHASARGPAALPEHFDQLPGAVQGGYSSEKVTVQLWWPSDALMASRVIGHLDVAAARFLATSLREHLRTTTGPAVGFHDWSRMTDYDGDARILLTDVAREALPRSEGVHVLVGSPLVAFGLRTASVVLRHVFSYVAREPFEAALTSSLRQLVPPPPKEEESIPSSGPQMKTCADCGTRLPDTAGSAYSLINSGWRLSRPTAGQRPMWHCPECWRSSHRKLGK